MSDVELVVVEDAETAARTVAERLAEAARAGSSIVLTGGSTPRRAYELAAELESDWSRPALYWGDERCVPPDDENSNFLLAKESLLDRVTTAPQSVHRIRGELGRDEAAVAYELELGTAGLDVLLLGLGPDGHVASLFPDAPTLDERDRRAVGAEAGLEPWIDRVTLTLPTLCGAREVLFLVTGGGKADAAARAFGGEPDRATPGSLVRSTAGRTWAVLDRAAASLL
ncbi:MAG TPA: 6-phosphogluconolactonase [Gaiellaceae bacterium]